MKDKTVLLQKLKALANKGIGGEKQNAERMLNSLMAKYNISEAELSEDKIIEANFTYHGEAQKTILVQIIYIVTNKKDNVYEYINTRTGRKRRTVIAADVTAAQKIEIEFLFDFYINQYEKEQDAFLKAFIYKHELYGDLDTGDTGEEPTEKADIAEIIKAKGFMRWMEEVTPVRRLEAGA